jgi:hypothetical protein
MGFSLALARTDAPRVRSTPQTVAGELRTLIRGELDDLPAQPVIERIAERAGRIRGVENVRLLGDDETLENLCSEGIQPRTLYLAFPDTQSEDAGIYGGLLGIDERHAMTVIVPDEHAAVTRAQLAQADGRIQACA